MEQTNKFVSFGKNILHYCGHYDWSFNFIKDSSEGYCWCSSKILDIGLKGTDINIKSLILHEISHIGTARFCNNKHNRSFWVKRLNLGYKFLKNYFPEWELLLYNLYFKTGFYSIDYLSESATPRL